jgi:hypothetical protein
MSGQTDSSGGTALRAFWRGLVRFLAIILTAVLLAALIYLAYILLYQQAVVPAQQSDQRVSLLETRQAQSQADTAQKLADFEQRLAALQADVTRMGEDLSTLQAQDAGVQSTLEGQSADLAALADQYEAVGTRLSSLEEQAALLDGAETPLAELEKEIVVLKAAGLLNRSRLYMLQSNYGLAEDEVRLARGLLVDLQQQATSSEKGALSAWIGRLDSALQALPDQPVMAGDDLEIAWQMLLRGLSAPLPTASATPTPAGPLVEDLQPTYTPWVTATLPAALTATPTAVQ